jgi:hypothetical protein
MEPRQSQGVSMEDGRLVSRQMRHWGTAALLRRLRSVIELISADYYYKVLTICTNSTFNDSITP